MKFSKMSWATLLLLCVPIAYGTSYQSNSSFLKSWKTLEMFTRLKFHDVFSDAESVLRHIAIDSKQCRDDIVSILRLAAKMDANAVKMIDANGKIPSGILTGTLNDLGAFDQCLTIPNVTFCSAFFKIDLPPRSRYHSIATRIDHQFQSLNFSNTSVINYLTKYAHYLYYAYFRMGLCLPQSCNETTVEVITQSLLNDVGLTVNVPRCETKDKFVFGWRKLSLGQVLAFSLITFIIGTVILCSIIYALWEDAKHDDSKIGAFALQRNIQRLFSQPNAEFELTFFHGLRFFSILWIILGHTYNWINFNIFRNSFNLNSQIEPIWFQPIMNGTVAVDTFFVMSGFLTYYGAYRYYKKTKNFSILYYISHRLWRFLPFLLLVMAFAMLLPLIGSGPIWTETVEPIYENCRKNWWANVLFVNYFVNTDEFCLLHTWYLGCDFHFCVLALIVILPLLKKRTFIGFANGLAIIFVGLFVTGFLTFVNDYPPTLLYGRPRVNEHLDWILTFYIKPWSHFGPYFIGLLCAYFFVRNREASNGFTLSNRTVTIGWTLFTLTTLTILFAAHEWNHGKDPSKLVTVTYASLHRNLWGLCISWLIFCCGNNRGGIVQSILKCRAIIPLSRLTFATYLTHPFLHWLRLGTVRERINVNHYDGLYVMIPTVVLAYIFGFVCSLFWEAPLLALEHQLFRSDGKQPKINEENEITQRLELTIKTPNTEKVQVIKSFCEKDF